MFQFNLKGKVLQVLVDKLTYMEAIGGLESEPYQCAEKIINDYFCKSSGIMKVDLKTIKKAKIKNITGYLALFAFYNSAKTSGINGMLQEFQVYSLGYNLVYASLAATSKTISEEEAFILDKGLKKIQEITRLSEQFAITN